MRSLKFPKMFQTNTTNVWKTNEYLDATKQNALLLLQTERGEMFGDPYMGLLFKHYLFDQTNFILKEALTDMIYTQLALFIPQIKIRREDVELTTSDELGKIYCKFKGTNQIDYKVDTYNLLIFQESNEA